MNKEKVSYFAGGCFWCTEAIFDQIYGVTKVQSGFSGGHTNNPSYYQVCSGSTGHAETVKVFYDPLKVKFEELLNVFFNSHDPTTKDRQGNDIGNHYRSAIFYTNIHEKELSEDFILKLNKDKVFTNKILTEIVEFKNFYLAESEHQNYYNNNKNQPYCSFVIKPKIQLLRKKNVGLLKK